jgi:hypothetical protein
MKACGKQSLWFLLGLIFDPENGDMFLRNVGLFPTDYMELHFRR